MAVKVNTNTTQAPITTGRTGTQVVKFIDCPRVYIKATDTTPTPVTTKSDGTKPTGWTDLGIVNGKAKVTYEKEIAEVRTGFDSVLRQQYVKQKTAGIEFVLSQFDDVVLEQLSGITPSVIQSGSTVQFAIGGEDIITKAILLVSQNKLDGKEWQFYHPGADLSFTLEDSGDETVVRGKGAFKSFTYGSSEALLIATDFA